MQPNGLQCFVIAAVVALCKVASPSPTRLSIRGLFDSFLATPATLATSPPPPPPPEAPVVAVVAAAPVNASATISTSTSTSPPSLFSSMSGWFAPVVSPEELARRREEALRAQREEEKRRKIEEIRRVVLKIPGVELADQLTRKTASAIGLGLGYSTARAQALVNDFYNRLRAKGQPAPAP
nr:SP25.8 [Bemisia tabaci]